MKHKNIAVYQKPKIVSKKVKLNYFYRSNSRDFDSLNGLLNIEVLAQSGGCGGCGSSKSIERYK